ncbi:MAG: V-type ATPase 116kDa subunit family protein [archaeon]
MDAVLLQLQTSGSLHPVETRELTPVERISIERRISGVNESLRKIEQILAFVRKETEVVIAAIDVASIDEMIGKYSRLEDIYVTLKRYEERSADLHDRIRQLSEQVNTLTAMDESHPGLMMRSLQYEGKTIFSRTIVSNLEQHEAIEKPLRDEFDTILKAVDRQRGLALFTVCGFVKSKNRLLGITGQHGAKISELPESDLLVSECVTDLGQKLKTLSHQRDNVEEESQSFLSDNLNEIALLRELLQNERDRLKILELAAESHFALVIEGWIPLREKEKLLVSLSRSIQGYWVYFEEIKEETAPSRLENLRPIRPFEIITKFFGIPEYHEWDPTPLLAYSFTLFFGLMFNDAIYGVVLLLAGRFFLHRLFEDPESQSFFMFRNFVYIIGVGTIVGGVLSGTYAGDMPQLLGVRVQPILKFFSNPVELMVVSMIIGLVHVNIAYTVKLLKSTKAKNTFGTIGVVALFGAQIFGIPFVLKAILGYSVPLLGNLSRDLLFWGAITSLGIYILCKVKLEGGFALFLWVFDLTSLLGDILSYTRLAGVGLAGFFLGSAFNLLSRMAFQTVYGIAPNMIGIILATVFGAAIFSIGHLTNIGLGVIGAFVHSLRLCLVEFLPKFFSGKGTDFVPLKMRINKRIMLRP